MKKLILFFAIVLCTINSKAGHYYLYIRQPDPTVMPDENEADFYIDSYVNFFATVVNYQPTGTYSGLYAAAAEVTNDTTGYDLIYLDSRNGESDKSATAFDLGGTSYRLHVIAIGGQASISVDW